MNAEQTYELLIAYAEGSLSAEQRQAVEEMLSRSPELQNDLEMITLAFDSLHVEQPPAVPEQYFANFTAVLRRNLAARAENRRRSIFGMLDALLKPAWAAAVVVCVITLFRLFEPPQSQPGIYSLVRGFEEHEIVSVVDESSVIAAAAAESVLEQKFPVESLGVDPSVYSSESEIFALLEENEAELVIAQLQQQ